MNAPKKEEASKVKKEKEIVCFDHSHFFRSAFKALKNNATVTAAQGHVKVKYNMILKK